MFCDNVTRVDISWQWASILGGDNARPHNMNVRADFFCCQMLAAGVS